jgi:vacuolar protein sorting-associated protein 26
VELVGMIEHVSDKS